MEIVFRMTATFTGPVGRDTTTPVKKPRVAAAAKVRKRMIALKITGKAAAVQVSPRGSNETKT
jgi:hypothetical protein